MKKSFWFSALFIVLLLFGFVFASCDSGGDESEDVTIRFDANGGAGSMASKVVKADNGNYTAPVCDFTAPGLPEGVAGTVTFKSWNTKADGSGVEYLAGATASIYKNTTLYAQWKKPLFSVSETKKVFFSKGNLVATVDASGNPVGWKFAANQYDYLGKGGANETIASTAGDVDLFGWSTDGGTTPAASYKPWGINTSPSSIDYTGKFVDWGKNIGDGNTWSTLSKDEWIYLLGDNAFSPERENASVFRKTCVTVCGKTNCLVIAPDDFKGAIADSYDADAWAAAEKDGLVCLAAAGSRTSCSVSVVGDSGYYWSSTAYDSDNAYNLFFSSIQVVYPGNHANRFLGRSVRLVREE